MNQKSNTVIKMIQKIIKKCKKVLHDSLINTLQKLQSKLHYALTPVPGLLCLKFPVVDGNKLNKSNE